MKEGGDLNCATNEVLVNKIRQRLRTFSNISHGWHSKAAFCFTDSQFRLIYYLIYWFINLDFVHKGRLVVDFFNCQVLVIDIAIQDFNFLFFVFFVTLLRQNPCILCLKHCETIPYNRVKLFHSNLYPIKVKFKSSNLKLEISQVWRRYFPCCHSWQMV